MITMPVIAVYTYNHFGICLPSRRAYIANLSFAYH